MSLSGSGWIPLGERDAWAAALARVPALPAHGHDFVAASAAAMGLDGGLWTWTGGSGGAVCPVLLRPVAGGGVDLVSPMGFGGFAVAGTGDGLAAAWTAHWTAHDAVAAYIQLHPHRSDEGWWDVLGGLSGALRPGPTVYVWDIDQPLAALERGLARDHRARLRQWVRQSPPTVVGGNAVIERFVGLYTDFADARALSRAYRFPPDALRALAGGEHALLVGAGAPVSAASLFIWRGTVADYYLNGAAAEGRQHARGLIWTAVAELQQRGVTALNLGGGVHAGGPLDKFKARFGAPARQTTVLAHVIQTDRYARLCAGAGVSPAADGYFPAYRQ